MTDNNTNPGFGLGLLSTLGQRPRVNGAWYHNQEITIDGYTFVGCRFDNCTLRLSSTNFEFESCFIDGSTQIVYAGEIIKPIRLFNSRYQWVSEHMPYFAPVRNADGTITIKA